MTTVSFPHKMPAMNEQLVHRDIILTKFWTTLATQFTVFTKYVVIWYKGKCCKLAKISVVLTSAFMSCNDERIGMTLLRKPQKSHVTEFITHYSKLLPVLLLHKNPSCPKWHRITTHPVTRYIRDILNNLNCPNQSRMSKLMIEGETNINIFFT